MRKTFILTILLTICFFVSTAPVKADEAEQKRTISVTGEAELRVVPDQVIISMTAESRNKALLDAQKQNDATISQLIAYVEKDLGVEGKNIQTDFTSVEPMYQQCNYRDEQNGSCSPLEITYYAVRKGVQIKLDKVDSYEALVTKALQLGVTHINNVEFVTTKLREHRDKAREMAATASKEKAAALAGALGMELGKPMTIHANQYQTFYQHTARGGNVRMMQNSIANAPSEGGMDGSSALALGQINITAQVNVTFEIH